MQNKLAITGITGKSGRAFAWYLEQNKEKILSRFKGGIVLFLHEKRDSDFEILKDFQPQIVYGDLKDASFFSEYMKDVDTLVHIAGIFYSEQIVKASANKVRRIIFVHTTGIYSKYKAAGKEYRRIDDFVIKNCEKNGILYTILRPTMIYGDLSDQNMIKFIKMVDSFPLMPMVGSGCYGLAPVHYGDLGKAYFDVLCQEEKTCYKQYDLSGKDAILLVDLFRLIAKKLEKKQIRFIRVPYCLSLTFAWLLFLVSIGQLDYREKVQRLCEDRVYPHLDATKDFQYHPRSLEAGIGEEVQKYLDHKKGKL